MAHCIGEQLYTQAHVTDQSYRFNCPTNLPFYADSPTSDPTKQATKAGFAIVVTISECCLNIDTREGNTGISEIGIPEYRPIFVRY